MLFRSGAAGAAICLIFAKHAQAAARRARPSPRPLRARTCAGPRASAKARALRDRAHRLFLRAREYGLQALERRPPQPPVAAPGHRPVQSRPSHRWVHRVRRQARQRCRARRRCPAGPRTRPRRRPPHRARLRTRSTPRPSGPHPHRRHLRRHGPPLPYALRHAHPRPGLACGAGALSAELRRRHRAERRRGGAP